MTSFSLLFVVTLLFPQTSLTLTQSTPGDTDANIHWERETCPSVITNYYAATLRLTGDFTMKCLTSAVTPSSLYNYQIRITSTGVPDHTSGVGVSSKNYVYNIPIAPLPLDTDEIVFQTPYLTSTLGGPNAVVGFALNGVPFVSALTGDNIDSVGGQNTKAGDDCLGFILDDGSYVYKTAPPCLFAGSEGKGRGKDLISEGNKYDFGNFMTGFGLYEDNTDADHVVYFDSALEGAPFVIGFALDGFPIYSPYDQNGDLHKGLDSCNGKYYEGSYAYFATDDFPYIVGCWGPGIYAGEEDALAHGGVTTERTNVTRRTDINCPAGRYVDRLGLNDKATDDYACTACPEGKFGRVGAGDSCDGICEAGYFCPLASSSPRQEVCGGARYYCPEGSGERLIVDPGFYTTPIAEVDGFGDNTNGTGFDGRELIDLATVRTGQQKCEIGYFCNGDGYRRACSEVGNYGNVTGLKTSACTGRCPRGSYCIPGAVPILCPAGRFGSEEGLQTEECSGLCDKGHYCVEGSKSATQAQCSSGIYGGEVGLHDASCSKRCDGAMTNCRENVCKEGYWCGPASTTGTQNECGGPHLFCPEQSSGPQTATAGYYTVGEVSKGGKYQSVYDENRRFDQRISEKGTYSIDGVRYPCPSGRFSDTEGNSNVKCVGPCDKGHFCEKQSISPKQNRCGGPHVYCPLNSSQPITVQMGYYSYDGGPDIRANEANCPKGSYCVEGVARLCPAGRWGGSEGLHDSKCDGACAPGYYCPEGSTISTQVVCSAGRYSTYGMGSAECSGKCARGFYCPEASSSRWEYECGGELNYCPDGSGIPMNVSIGYYSVGGDNSTTRHGQTKCEAFDHNGGKSGGAGESQLDLRMVGACPTTTRTADDVVRPIPKQLDVDYPVDADKEQRFDDL